MKRSSFLAGGAGLLLAGLVVVPNISAQAASSKTITGQTNYTCAGQPKSGGPSYSDTFGIRLSLSVPATAAPGTKFSPKGTFSLQFPESVYQIDRALGITSAEASSDNIAMTVVSGGKSSRLVAYRWDSGSQPVRNPMVVTAPIAFPAITVPAGASGAVQMYMPENGAVKNPIAEGPATVAFTLNGTTHGSSGTTEAWISCWMPTAKKVSVGQVAIGQSSGTQGGTPGQTGSGGTAAGGTTGSNDSDAAANGDVPTAATGNDSGSVASTGSGSTVESANNQAASTPLFPSASGFFVKTNLLILLGFIVCLAGLTYGALMHIRLRGFTHSPDA
jgi:hypothetical protein